MSIRLLRIKKFQLQLPTMKCLICPTNTSFFIRNISNNRDNNTHKTTRAERKTEEENIHHIVSM